MKTYEPPNGENITKTAKRMVDLANETKAPVTAKFNEIALMAKPDDSPRAIARYYHTESNRRHKKYLSSPEYKRQQRVAEEFRRGHDRMLQDALAVAPKKMTLKDEESWKKIVAANADGYGDEVINFAERWARLMESQIVTGGTLEACAESASSLADNEGITGFMYGEAVRILSKVWVHGEQLRRWHNLKIQIGNEGKEANETGRVLNPALLSLG